MTNHLTKEEFFSESGIPLIILPRNPQEPYPRHTHDFSELVIVTGGKGIHFIGDEEYTVRTGDVFVIHGDRAHGYSRLEDLLLFNILFDLDILGPGGEELKEISGYHALFKWEPRLRTKHRFESRLSLSPES